MTAPTDSSADDAVLGPPPASVHAEIGETEIILFDEQSDMVVTLNETGSAIWTLCDGTRTMHQIVDELAELFDVTPDSIRHDVAGLVAQLTEAGFLAG